MYYTKVLNISTGIGIAIVINIDIQISTLSVAQLKLPLELTVIYTICSKHLIFSNVLEPTI